MFDKMENEEDYLNTVLFSDEATFNLSGKVNRHNERIWGTEDSHEIVEHVRDSPKLNVFCAVSSVKVYGPFCFIEPIVTGISYPDMVEKYLAPQLQRKTRPEISCFNEMGHPRISVETLLPTSIAR